MSIRYVQFGWTDAIIIFIPSLSFPLEPREEIIPHLVMPGHRSIVNQTRYSNVNHLLCSSGVEKIFKVHP